MSEVDSKLNFTDASLESKQAIESKQTTENLEKNLNEIARSIMEYSMQFKQEVSRLSKLNNNPTAAEKAKQDSFASEEKAFFEIYKIIERITKQTKASSEELKEIQDYINSCSKKLENPFVKNGLTKVQKAMETLNTLLTEFTELATATKTFHLQIMTFCDMIDKPLERTRCKTTFSTKLKFETNLLQAKIVKTNAKSCSPDDVTPLTVLVDYLKSEPPELLREFKGKIKKDDLQNLNNYYLPWLKVVTKTYPESAVRAARKP